MKKVFSPFAYLYVNVSKIAYEIDLIVCGQGDSKTSAVDCSDCVLIIYLIYRSDTITVIKNITICDRVVAVTINTRMRGAKFELISAMK